MKRTHSWGMLAATAVLLAACSQPEEQSTMTEGQETAVMETAAVSYPEYEASVTSDRLINADEEPGQWMSNGRDYWEQRYSPLSQINTDTVSDLGLVWSADLDTSRGQEATPIVVDGALYVTTAWSMVKAYDAKSGELLWQYDPEVDRAR